MSQATGKPGEESQKAVEGRYRQYRGPMATLVKFMAVGLCLFFLLYVSGALPMAGIYFIFYQLNGVFVAAILILVILLYPAGKQVTRHKLPWYDVLLILGALVSSLYVIINAVELAYFPLLTSSTMQTALGIIALVVLLESIRRTIGWSMIIIVLAFLLHAKFSYLLAGSPFSVREQQWPKIIATAYLSYTGMFGSLTTLACTVIFTFVTFAAFLMSTKGGEFFLNLALCLTGTYRGGPAKAAIVGSALFGTLTSSPSANVATTGCVTIPLMKSIGYSPAFAGAVESVASTGGLITPPVLGSVAFIMAVLLGISYASICLAAVIPACLYYIALFTQTDLRAGKAGLKGVPRSELPSLSGTLRGGWEYCIPLLTLVVLLFVLKYAPPLAATYSLGTVILVNMFRKRYRLSLKQFIGSLASATLSMLIILPAIAGSGIITGLLGMTGLGPMFASGLVQISGGNSLVLFILCGAACYVMGMGVSPIPTYILLAVLVAPALQVLGVPLLVSHFFIFYMGSSMHFTPPNCPACFVAAGIANIKPFPIALQAMRLGIVAYLVPFILIFNPLLILMGEPLQIVLATVTAIIGVLSLSIGIERYLFTKTNWPQTVLALAAGICMMAPAWMIRLIGIGLLALVVLWQWVARKNRTTVPALES